MYRIEIEKTNGNVSLFGQNGLWATLFESEESADEIAASLWESYGYTGKYARFSVVDGSGERVTDWEC